MPRFFIFLFFAILSLSLNGLEVSLETQNAILINAQTGAILFEKNAHLPCFPASTTKVATALYALKRMGEVQEVALTAKSEALGSITPEAKKQSNYRNPPHLLETDGTHMSLNRGEEVPFIDLMHGLLMASANDAANVIALHIGGTIPRFMDQLNAYLREEVGTQNTRFYNPHGLHHPEHQTSAYDMALMAKEAMKHPLFREIVAKRRYLCPATNLHPERIFTTHNALLKKGSYSYPRAIGIKTGFMSHAGETLVAAAQEGERLLIAVLFKVPGKQRYAEAIKLFNAAFDEVKRRRILLPPGVQTFTREIQGAKKPLKVSLPEGLSYDFYPSEEIPVKVRVIWEKIMPPLQERSLIGKIQIINASLGRVLMEQPLFAAEKVESNFWHRMGLYDPLVRRRYGGGALLSLALLGGALYFLRRRYS